MIIWILFAIVMTFLIAKATIETIIGLCQLIYGVTCILFASILDVLAWVVRFCGRLSGKMPKNPRRAMTWMEHMIVASEPNSRKAKRIRASLW